MEKENVTKIWKNMGATLAPHVTEANYPNADDIVRQGLVSSSREGTCVDVLLVNPPTPDGELWIRSQHRVGRRTRENMVWPQVDLAQMAALLHPTYRIRIIDANAEHMSWGEFEKILEECHPQYYFTQLTAPTLENDMYGCFLAKARGAVTIAFGTHITPIPRETLRPYPALDYGLVGEPDLTLRDLIDHLEGKVNERPDFIKKIFDKEPGYRPSYDEGGELDLHRLKGLVWRKGSEIVLNANRPFIQSLDDLPMPMHELLPLEKYRMPLLKSPFTFIVPSRGCPAGCIFCIKHVSYQHSSRLRSPELIVEEMLKLKSLGVKTIHMYADLFTINRDQVVNLCNLLIKEKVNLPWMCNSRVDFVDKEMLQLMAKAGNTWISWGIESANEQVLKHAHKGINPEKVIQALTWSNEAGINNWGYFIIGLPGETEESIRETVNFAKKLPLKLVLFHIAAPYPGTPFFFEVVQNGWFRPGTRWEQVDMDKGTVLDYPGLPAERLIYWQKKAFREWAFRPKPMVTYLKMLLSDISTLKSAVSVGVQALDWRSDE